jgi:hypothetical protein
MSYIEARERSRRELKILGYEPNELQIKFRDGFFNVKLVEFAIVDALTEQGCIDAWRGDGVACVAQMIEAQAKEVERLKRGDFTPEEFQNLCHNLSEDDKEKFVEGCREYQKKLFGESDKCPNEQ